MTREEAGADLDTSWLQAGLEVDLELAGWSGEHEKIKVQASNTMLSMTQQPFMY